MARGGRVKPGALARANRWVPSGWAPQAPRVGKGTGHGDWLKGDLMDWLFRTWGLRAGVGPVG